MGIPAMSEPMKAILGLVIAPLAAVFLGLPGYWIATAIVGYLIWSWWK
jgi:hypothetical protein